MAKMGHYTPSFFSFQGLMIYSFCLGLFLRERLTPLNLEKLKTCKDHSLFYPCFIAEVTNPEISHSSYPVQMLD